MIHNGNLQSTFSNTTKKSFNSPQSSCKFKNVSKACKLMFKFEFFRIT